MDYSVKEIEIDLSKYWSVLRRRWPIILMSGSVTTVLAAVFVAMQKPIYQSQAKLLFESSSKTSSIVGLQGASRELKALTSRDDPLDTQVQVFRSTPIAEQVIKELQIKGPEGKLLKPSALLSKVDVKGIPGTDVLSISYRSPDPKMATNVVNTMMDVFIQNDIQVNRAAAVAAQEFLVTQLPTSEQAVSNAELALQIFKEANSIVDLGVESENTVQVLSTLDNRLTNLQADFADSDAQSNQLQSKLRLSASEAYAIGLVSESPGVQETLQQLQALQTELSIARTRYEDVHPEIVSLRRQEEVLMSLLERRIDLVLGDSQLTLPLDDLQAGSLEKGIIADFLNLESEQAGLQRQIETLSNAQQAQRERAVLLPSLEKRQRELERQLNAAQSTYETLLKNLQQAQVLANQNVGNARVVSPASVPEDSNSSSSKLPMIAGGLLGLCLGTMAAFLVDLLDRAVKTVREGQELYEYPLLGVIPAWKKLPHRQTNDMEIPSVLVRESQQGYFAQAYQALQANLKFSYLDKSLKAFTVTSAVSGEGKSEVVANLALTLAQLGHLVLVVDADLRAPIQHHIWHVTNMQGLTNVVAGQVSLQQAIVRLEPNLHILPAGAIPPNPLAILESAQMTTLLKESKLEYDYIIIDSPAISGLADTLTIGRIADGMMVVMQPERVDSVSINETKSLLAQSQQKILGLVANGIKDSNKSEQYFYHNQEYLVNNNQYSWFEQPDVADKKVSINS